MDMSELETNPTRSASLIIDKEGTKISLNLLVQCCYFRRQFTFCEVTFEGINGPEPSVWNKRKLAELQEQTVFYSDTDSDNLDERIPGNLRLY